MDVNGRFCRKRGRDSGVNLRVHGVYKVLVRVAQRVSRTHRIAKKPGRIKHPERKLEYG
jgi:hypothetical protein